MDGTAQNAAQKKIVERSWVVQGNTYAEVAVFSRRMSKLPNLSVFLGADRAVWRPGGWRADRADAVAGWGHKPTADRPRAFANQRGLPYLALEDGFLRSLGLGTEQERPLSLIVDDLGIYYDARSPSRLETMLNDPAGIAAEDLDLALDAINLIRKHRLSKYNDAPDVTDLPGDGKRRVLVVDQTRNDMSVLVGQADEGSFRSMLQSALDQNPGAEIVVKLHPETIAGAKRGYLSEAEMPAGVRIIANPVNPHALFERCDKVYTVSSQLGFEALLAGLPVSCHGMPFYAGWGATEDAFHCQRRQQRRTAPEIFAAAYMRYARYVDPVTGKTCGIERIIEHLAEARQVNEANRGTVICVGMQRWKRRHIRPFLANTGGETIFARDGRAALRKGARPGDRILVWGDHKPSGISLLESEIGTTAGRVEDGFLRSVGLGSDFVRPNSIAVDWQGAYYDPERPSDLETIFASCDFQPETLARAGAIRRRIVEAGLSKYNVGSHSVVRPSGTDGRRLLLVPGQVETDASVRYGGGGIRSNLELVKKVRAANPDAFIAYKPHPDVVAWNRRGGRDTAAIATLCDEVWAGANINDCLALCEEVHTLTSLTGFEALLRGLKVVTYGGPFYAGWGLTDDRLKFPRRTRKLSLDELVAGALILYPRYFDWQSGTVCSCEAIVERLTDRFTSGSPVPLDAGPIFRPDRLVRRLARLIRESVHA